MNKKFKHYFSIYITLLAIGIVSLFTSCSDNDPDTPKYEGPQKSTILVYAVATNSLSGNLISDKEEMLDAAASIDLDNNNVLVFETTYYNVPRLLKISKLKNEYVFEVVKEYPENLSSLDPAMITQVINDALNTFPALNYGLILWSHGTGWTPFSTEPYGNEGIATCSFGYDNDPGSSSHIELNIDDLADAIPDNTFDFIWFDACYMSGIETIYELRDKCRYFIGYPTEVFEFGMPYDLVLPSIVGENPDLVGAAKNFFDYYALNVYSFLQVATVAVLDMSKLEEMADLCKIAYSSEVIVNPDSFIKYSRKTIGPFYDLGDYTKAMNQDDPELFEQEWNRVISEFIIYKAATPKDFNGYPINSDNYTGISCHIYDYSDVSSKENFYRQLDWFKRVYPN